MAADPSDLCTLADVRLESNKAADETGDDGALARYITDASAMFCIVTGQEYLTAVAVAEVVRPPNVILRGDGVLYVRVARPHITAVSALAWRAGPPSAAWSAIDLALVDFDPAPLSARRTITADLGGGGPVRRARLWAQVSYTAGWDGPNAATPTLPADIQRCVAWWAAWLFRKRDAPFDRTATGLTGQVTIPSSLPSHLCAVIDRYKATAVL